MIEQFIQWFPSPRSCSLSCCSRRRAPFFDTHAGVRWVNSFFVASTSTPASAERHLIGAAACECSKISNSVRASNLASNCSERLWLHVRTFLVATENRLGWLGESNWRRTLPLLPLTTPPVLAAKTRIQRCLYKAVDEIWQCRTGRTLTTFDKDYGTAEEGLQKQSSYSQAYGFATITTYSWWQPGEIGCA